MGGLVYGALEHFRIWNTPFSKYRSQWLRDSFGQLNARAAFVSLYVMAPVGFGIGAFVFGQPARLGATLFLLHFVKRIVECSCIHIYSSPMDKFTTMYLASCYIVIGMIFAFDLTLATPSSQPFGGSDFAVPWTVLWALGEAINGFHHWLLSKLRRRNGKAAEENLLQSEYSLPVGGLFGKLLFPHYMGEMLAWFATAAIVNRGGVWGLNFFMLGVQCGRCSAGRQWYVEKFGEEAIATRSNIIPGVF